MPPSIPDWLTVAGVVAVLGAIGGLLAHVSGFFKQRGDARQEQQLARDKNATDNATLTLDSVFKLVNELQEEVGRKGLTLEACERRCDEQLGKINSLNAEVAGLKDEVTALKAEVTDLQRLKERRANQ